MPLPSPTPDGCLIYLVRHAVTSNNVANPPVLQGQQNDPELTLLGVRQAVRTAATLSRVKLTRVFSSPLKRARMTAVPIAEEQGLQVETVPELTEIDVGEWEGLSWQAIEEQFPREYEAFMADSTVEGYPDGESLSDVSRRVVPKIAELASQNLGHSIGVVAHNMVNRVFLTEVLGVEVSRAPDVNQDNCGVSVIRFRRTRFKLLGLNSTFHLLD